MENIFTPNQRIIILQGLQRSPDYRLSTYMLQRLLRLYGHAMALAQVNDQVNWLEDRGLVRVDRSAQPVVVVEILKPGVDLATGYARLEGVDPPNKDD